jgi:nucleoside 2-deoxyribosyltransferase
MQTQGIAVNPKVYLAGPISGLSYGGATDWRVLAKAMLRTNDIDAFSPLRHQQNLASIQIFSDLGSETERLKDPMSTTRGLTVRDRWDAQRCDVMLVNLLGAKKVSIGTVLELAWADARRIPIVVAMEADGSNPHEHAMIHEIIGFRTPDLDSAVVTTVKILKP